jgi:glutamate racemase
MSKIGVFDSGAGGESVVAAIKKAMPEHEVIFRDDREHLPYGTKSIDEIRSYVTPIIKEMAKVCNVIVVACNTVSTNLIKELRQEVEVPLIAMEPMVKPAAEQTKTGVITVCATPRTLTSERYKWLKDTYAKDVKVLEPDCSDWTSLIENKEMDHSKIRERIEPTLEKGSDVIVLGCTHYHWIEEDIKAVANGRAKVLQPEQPVIEQLKRVLAQTS